MKYLFCLLIFITCATSLAQVPNGIKYQAIARKSSGEILQNQKVSFAISIIPSSPDQNPVYTETHTTETNAFGLVNLVIGKGSVLVGEFSNIDWSPNDFFISISMDETGESNFTWMGTSQLLSVPFAFYAESVLNDQVNDADSNSTNEIQELLLREDSLKISHGNSVILPRTHYWESSGLNTNSTDVSSQWTKLDDYLIFQKINTKSKIEIIVNSRFDSGTFEGNPLGIQFAIRVDDMNGETQNFGVIQASNQYEFLSLFSVFHKLEEGLHTASIWARVTGGTSSNVGVDPGGWGGRMVIKEVW